MVAAVLRSLPTPAPDPPGSTGAGGGGTEGGVPLLRPGPGPMDPQSPPSDTAGRIEVCTSPGDGLPQDSTGAKAVEPSGGAASEAPAGPAAAAAAAGEWESLCVEEAAAVAGLRTIPVGPAAAAALRLLASIAADEDLPAAAAAAAAWQLPPPLPPAAASPPASCNSELLAWPGAGGAGPGWGASPAVLVAAGDAVPAAHGGPGGPLPLTVAGRAASAD